MHWLDTQSKFIVELYFALGAGAINPHVSKIPTPDDLYDFGCACLTIHTRVGGPPQPWPTHANILSTIRDYKTNKHIAQFKTRALESELQTLVPWIAQAILTYRSLGTWDDIKTLQAPDTLGPMTFVANTCTVLTCAMSAALARMILTR